MDNHNPNIKLSISRKFNKMLNFQTMETLQEGGELVFLFHLTDGHTSSSYAAYTALQAGLPTDVVQRGKEVKVLICVNSCLFAIDFLCLKVRSFG